jgi:predicted MPP superfamily phosphohydrolase
MQRRPNLNRREFLKLALATGIGLPVAAAAYSLGVEPAWIEVTHTEVFLPGLPLPFEGFRIAHLSDLHYGTYLPLSRLERVVELVNALGADLIALTGDYVSEPVTMTYLRDRILRLPNPIFRHSPNAAAVFGTCIPRLAQIEAPFGLLAVLGNHDHWVDAAVGREHLAAAGIRSIDNRHVVLEQGDAALVVAGVDDLWEGVQDLEAAFKGAPPAAEAPRLVLCHNPDYGVDPALDRHRVSLMLSGHTHGGQVTIPGLGAPVLPIDHRQFARGLVRTPWGQVYVSRGVGQTMPPMRILTRPEIAVIQLRVG